MVVVLCTVPDSLDQAELLASKMVERRLAACVNLIPQVRSLFRWDGAVAREAELLMMIKTTEEMVVHLTSFLQEHHPYDVPEVVALPAQAALPYGTWVQDSVRDEKGDKVSSLQESSSTAILSQDE